MRLIFDASALLNIIRLMGSDALSHLKGNYILSLTLYEVGNALWKEATLLNRISIDEALSLFNWVNQVCRVLNVITPRDTSLILRLAYDLKLTFYDSSYIVGAGEINGVLITDDERLRRRIISNRDLLVNLLNGEVVTRSTKELIEG